MKVLKDILYKVTINAVVGRYQVLSIDEINYDSREACQSMTVFVAISGVSCRWTRLHKQGHRTMVL